MVDWKLVTKFEYWHLFRIFYLKTGQICNLEIICTLSTNCYKLGYYLTIFVSKIIYVKPLSFTCKYHICNLYIAIHFAKPRCTKQQAADLCKNFYSSLNLRQYKRSNDWVHFPEISFPTELSSSVLVFLPSVLSFSFLMPIPPPAASQVTIQMENSELYFSRPWSVERHRSWKRQQYCFFSLSFPPSNVHTELAALIPWGKGLALQMGHWPFCPLGDRPL